MAGKNDELAFRPSRITRVQGVDHGLVLPLLSFLIGSTEDIRVNVAPPWTYQVARSHSEPIELRISPLSDEPLQHGRLPVIIVSERYYEQPSREFILASSFTRTLPHRR